MSILGYGSNLEKIIKISLWGSSPSHTSTVFCHVMGWWPHELSWSTIASFVAPYKHFCQCFIWVKTDSLCSVNIHPSLVEACLSVGWFKYLPGLWIPNGVRDRRGGLRWLTQTNGDVSVYVWQWSFKFCSSLRRLLGRAQEKHKEWWITWPKGAGAEGKLLHGSVCGGRWNEIK